MIICGLTFPVGAQPIRIAVFHTGFGRDGPGLLLRDIRRAEPDILAARDALVRLRPDAVLLLDFDYDLGGLALNAFAALLAEGDWPLENMFALRPNTGLATGMDMDGNGRRGEADDAQGWGRFSGAGGMALLSRLPILADTAISYTEFLWRDLPDARLPRVDDRPYPSEAVFDIQRLSSTAHWEVALETPQGPLTLMAWHAGPPVFGGPHQRNYNRNADETAFWRWRLETRRVPEPFVLIGDSNLDAEAGAGDRSEMAALLSHPSLQDPAPSAPLPSGGPAMRATANWPDGPGALRVDYVLPSATLQVLDTGLIWPTPAARHAIVWADVQLPP